MIYPLNWYRSMVSAATEDPSHPAVRYGAQTWMHNGAVTFSRPDEFVGTNAGHITALLLHPFSGSGLFVPKLVMERVNKEPNDFLSICPTSDDIWLHREFYRQGIAVRDLGGVSMPPSIPFNKANGLHSINWSGGQNEVQIREAFRELN